MLVVQSIWGVFISSRMRDNGEGIRGVIISSTCHSRRTLERYLDQEEQFLCENPQYRDILSSESSSDDTSCSD